MFRRLKALAERPRGVFRALKRRLNRKRRTEEPLEGNRYTQVVGDQLHKPNKAPQNIEADLAILSKLEPPTSKSS